MEENTPQLSKRRANRKSTMKSGRTIGEKRERLETASERAAVHKKNQFKKRLRFFVATAGFIIVVILLIFLFSRVFNQREEASVSETIKIPYTPTIEIVDEAVASSKDSRITERMKEYIGQAEVSFRELGYVPTKAVIPASAIREVDFYLDGRPGFIKMLIDRGSGVSVEDADRMLRYLESQGVDNFQYIDVRISGKAYYK